MPDTAPTAALRDECRVFCRHLIGREPDAYIVEKYVEAHAVGAHVPRGEQDAFDAWLARIAARGPALARLADAYTRLLRRDATVRRKLTLLLAILESAPATHGEFDPRPRSLPIVLGRLAVAGLAAVIVALAAVALLSPVRAALALRSGAPAPDVRRGPSRVHQ